MEGTYEYELERAELLGVDPLSREEWEIQNRARLQAQLEQQQICDEKAQEIQAEAEQIQGGHGKMDELNSILNATQMKLNKFKTVCGGFTGFLKIRTASPAPAEGEAAAAPAPVPAEPVPTTSSDINSGLDNLERMQQIEGQTELEFVKDQMIENEEKAKTNLSALDRLLSKAESATAAMESQRQQMRNYLKK